MYKTIVFGEKGQWTVASSCNDERDTQSPAVQILKISVCQNHIPITRFRSAIGVQVYTYMCMGVFVHEPGDSSHWPDLDR